ncbi:MAG: hypothetical protein AAF226_01460 [Verrucomicrobiota bacterium]
METEPNTAYVFAYITAFLVVMMMLLIVKVTLQLEKLEEKLEQVRNEGNQHRSTIEHYWLAQRFPELSLSKELPTLDSNGEPLDFSERMELAKARARNHSPLD